MQVSKIIKYKNSFLNKPFVFRFLLLLSSLVGMEVNAQNPLTPLKLDSPRDTMKTFMNSMNEYKQGVEKNDETKKLQIENAVRCLDIREMNPLLREEKGKESAIFLKEAIDRVYVLELNKIPDVDIPSAKWSIPDTEIILLKISSGSKAGEYQFSSETVMSANEFYRRTKHLPFLAKTGGGAAYSLPWMETIFPKWARKKYGFFYLWQWLGLILAILFSFILKLISRLAFYILMKVTRRTSTLWDDKVITTLSRPTGYFVGIAFWFSFLYAAGVEGNLFAISNIILKVLLGANFIFFVYKISDLVVMLLKDNSIREKNPIDEQLIPLLSKSLRILFVTLGFLIALQNLGINVMGLIAGLGIGGLAIALAAKDTAANLFGSAMIFMDRPFKIGDHILIDNREGIVEEIGFRSTRIRTWEDSIVSIPNSVVANSDIENMGVRRWRRNVIILNLTYDTSPEKMEAFLEGIKNIVKKNPLVVADTMNIAFKNFDSSSLNVLMQFGLAVDTLPKNLEGRQKIFFEVIRLAKELGVDFAYPTSTLHVETIPDKKPARVPKEKPIPKYKNIASEFGEGGKLSKPNGAEIFVAPYHELPTEDKKS